MITIRSTQPPSDNDSLQADVMRFMAIIAFCLIAILALVKEVEPVQAQTQPISAAVTHSVPIELVTAAVEQPIATPAESWREPLPQPATEVEVTRPTRKPQSQPPLLQLEQLNKPVGVAARTEPVTAPSTSITNDSDPDSTEQIPSPSEAEGLSLRFASDGDFLRLIARGDIKVYAFNGSDVLGLSEGYEFLTAHSPGKVYELLPQTIPTLIFDSLSRSRLPQADSDGYSWGITLPTKIETQISGFLASAENGALVIDKYGEVHHVAQN